MVIKDNFVYLFLGVRNTILLFPLSGGDDHLPFSHVIWYFRESCYILLLFSFKVFEMDVVELIELPLKILDIAKNVLEVFVVYH